MNNVKQKKQQAGAFADTMLEEKSSDFFSVMQFLHSPNNTVSKESPPVVQIAIKYAIGKAIALSFFCHCSLWKMDTLL